MIEKNITFSERIVSMLIDGIIIMGIAMIFIILLFILGLGNDITSRILLLSLIYSLFLCKDLYQGQSFGKKKFNLKIISINNKELSSFKLIIRNLFIVIWPIEIIMCLINPQRRLGDIIVGSKLVYDKSNNKTLNLKKYIIILTIVMILCFSFLYFVFYTLIPENMIRILYS
jgi:uncharacterized RDD family membrane protein YckC